MTEADTLEVTRESLMLTLEISLPILLIALVVGLIISLIQALTQIQEMTLTFVPKIVAIFLSLLLLGPFMFDRLRAFTLALAARIVAMS